MISRLRLNLDKACCSIFGFGKDLAAYIIAHKRKSNTKRRMV